MIEDPIVEEVRKVRDELSKKFNYDLKAIFDDLRKKQKQYENRVVDLSKAKKEEYSGADS